VLMARYTNVNNLRCLECNTVHATHREDNQCFKNALLDLGDIGDI